MKNIILSPFYIYIILTSDSKTNTKIDSIIREVKK